MVRRAGGSTAGIAFAWLASNAITLGFALWLDWPLGMLLWPYWLQSLVIGGFAVRRILVLQAFSTEGFRMGNQRVPEDVRGKRRTAAFFALHFGFFHFVYFIFLIGMAPLAEASDVLVVLACALAFGLAQRRTFREQVADDAKRRPNLGLLMFLPYLRIVPMHLAIILGMGLGPLLPLLVFIPLKTLADIGLDLLDRRVSEASMLDWLKARGPRPPEA